MHLILGNIKKPLFRSILYSYILLCILLLGLTGVVSAYQYKTLKAAIVRNGRQEAELISSQFNDQMEAVRKALNGIAGNSTLRGFADYSDADFSLDSNNVNRFCEELFNAVQSDICSDIRIWFDENQSMIGARNHRYDKELMPAYLRSIGVSEEEFRDILDYKGLYGFHVMSDGTIWIMRSALDKRYARFAVVIAMIDPKSVRVPFRNEEGDNLYLLYHGKELIYSARTINADVVRTLPELDTDREVRIDGRDYLPLSHDLFYPGLNLRTLIPTYSIYSGLRIFIFTTVCELLGAIILVAGFLALQTHTIYAPIQQLMELLRSRESGEFEETYANLIGGLSSLKSDYGKLIESHRLEAMKRELSIVQRGLTGAIDLSVADEDAEGGDSYAGRFAEWVGFADGTRWSMAMIHVPEKWEEVFGKDPIEDPIAGMEGFILKNVIGELLGQDYPFNLAPVRGDYVLLAGMEAPGAEKDLAERLEKLRMFFQQAFEIDLTVILGAVHEHYSELPAVYHQLEEELRYSLFWGIEDARDGILQVGQADENENEGPAFSLENNRRLLNCLDIGDYENAGRIMDEILQSLPRDRRYLNYSIYRMYGLISMLSMVFEGSSADDDTRFWEDLDYENRLYNIRTMPQLIAITRELFDQIIAYNAGKNAGSEPGWLGQVLQYIQENYCDINLSVTSIADRFHLSVPHLSRTFKSSIGCGLLEYIQRLRVEKARELLEEGVSVTEAAERVGYAETKALRRVFKRYEGINPSDYRKNLE